MFELFVAITVFENIMVWWPYGKGERGGWGSVEAYYGRPLSILPVTFYADIETQAVIIFYKNHRLNGFHFLYAI